MRFLATLVMTGATLVMTGGAFGMTGVTLVMTAVFARIGVKGFEVFTAYAKSALEAATLRSSRPA